MRLTESEETRLEKFSKNHNPKHIEIMRKEMEEGRTFQMANTIPNQPIIFDYSDDCLLASDELKVKINELATISSTFEYKLLPEPAIGPNTPDSMILSSTSSST